MCEASVLLEQELAEAKVALLVSAAKKYLIQ